MSLLVVLWEVTEPFLLSQVVPVSQLLVAVFVVSLFLFGAVLLIRAFVVSLFLKGEFSLFLTFVVWMLETAVAGYYLFWHLFEEIHFAILPAGTYC